MHPGPRAMPLHWDIFCRVIDNFGDAGVTWRLARQLAAEHGAQVRVFLDDIPTLTRLDHRVRPELATQTVAGVTVCRWSGDVTVERVGDVVLETFACEAPPRYVAAMAALSHPPAWINLEYLSAEEWVGRCHCLPSPHPNYPLTRYFFFPGFDEHSGGLLRETDLLARRDAFRASSASQAAFWSDITLAPPLPGTLVASLFGYDTVQLHDLLDTWMRGERPVRCLIPEDTPLAQRAARHLEHRGTGRSVRQRSLEVVWVPFRDQVDFDPLLWISDFNFVRGEDSFVRAQWAARPMAWHVYPQTARAHWVKLEAFLERYLEGLEETAAGKARLLFAAWNGAGDMASAWNGLLPLMPALDAHARQWADRQARHPDLAKSLVKFAEKVLE
jgi:uncharacterized repeat protein (TIGR03837 family)